jgi:hypothetical protein
VRTAAARFAALLAIAYLASAAAVVASSPWFKWNELRLSCVAGLLEGYSLYATPESGPILGWIYPPLAALFYLPAALIANPARAVVAGSLIAASCATAPAAWLHFRRSERERFGLASCWIAFSTFGIFTTTLLALRYSCYAVHVDAPALGAVALACGVLSEWLGTGRGGRSVAPLRDGWTAWRGLAIAAGSAALAVACKQTLLPVIVVLALWVAIERGGRAAAVFGAVATSTLALLIVALGAWLGYRGMWLNAVEIPRRHPLEWGHGDLATHALIPAIGCFIVLGTAWVRPRLRDRADYHRWLPLVAVGIALVPSALLSRAKHGGDVNSYSLFLYFFALAASLELKSVLVPIWSRASISRVVRLATLAALAALAAGGLAIAYQQGVTTVLTEPSPIARALDLERAQANGIYFPYHPLVMLRIDGRLYHDSRAVSEWKVAGIQLPPARMTADLPHRQRTIAMRDFESPRAYLGSLTPIAAPPGPVYDLKFFAQGSPPRR